MPVRAAYLSRDGRAERCWGGRAEAVLSAPAVLVASLPGLRNNGNGPATACPAVPEGGDSLNPRVVRVKA